MALFARLWVVLAALLAFLLASQDSNAAAEVQRAHKDRTDSGMVEERREGAVFLPDSGVFIPGRRADEFGLFSHRLDPDNIGDTGN